MEIPKYVATCQDGEIYFYGVGDTPDEAFDEFIHGGDFEDYCDYDVIKPGMVDVDIWTAIDIKKSDYEDGTYPEHWKWCLHQHVETREAEYKGENSGDDNLF